MEFADRKNDGKLEWHNFPLFLIRPMIGVAHFGGRKYETFNFLKGGNQNQYLDCIKRHLDAYEDPLQSDIDESGESHLAHVAWNALVAIYMLEHFPELDDRFKPNKEETITVKCKTITDDSNKNMDPQNH